VKVTIAVKFIGSLRHVSGTGELALSCKSYVAIRELMNEITKELPELKRSLIGHQLEDPRSNTLVLVNGREISVLDGLETKLKDGDEVVFIPFVHGG
jgi:molybdopterin synthase sulfur carrier subunit